MEASAEVADRGEARGITNLADGQVALTQQCGSVLEADGANILCGVLARGRLYLPVEGQAAHAQVCCQLLYAVAVVATETATLGGIPQGALAVLYHVAHLA